MYKFQIGDKVRHNKGGGELTVRWLNGNDVEATWLSDDGCPQSNWWPAYQLLPSEVAQ